MQKSANYPKMPLRSKHDGGCISLRAANAFFSLQYMDALKLCNEHNIILNETLVEKLTPEKTDGEDDTDRIRILEAIATVCMNQRQYHLATKKYTQAGNRIKVRACNLSGFDHLRHVSTLFIIYMGGGVF